MMKGLYSGPLGALRVYKRNKQVTRQNRRIIPITYLSQIIDRADDNWAF